MDIALVLDRARDLFPDAVAVVDGEREFTYRHLHARVVNVAESWRHSALAVGDRVSILSWNRVEFLEVYFAAARARLILNPLNVRLAAREQALVLRDAGSRVLVAEAAFSELVDSILDEGTSIERVVWLDQVPCVQRDGVEFQAYEDLARERTNVGPSPRSASESTNSRDAAQRPARPEPASQPQAVDSRVVEQRPKGDDVAHLYYTSGTTGTPKGVMLTHRNVTTHALGTIAELSLSDRDTWAHIAPMFHLADAWATFAITWVGGRHVMLAKFDAERALELFVRERVTITNLIPTMLNLMVKHPTAVGRDYAALRVILSGGAPIAPDVVRAIIATFGCDYVQTYGMTETSPYLTLSLLKNSLRALSEREQVAYKCKTGRSFVTIELRVVGSDGRDIEPDERAVGEIRVRGDTVTPGYWNRPDETRAAFEDGWLKTGDLAVIDREGYVTIVDRAKDMILTGGENVYSTEVEHALYAHSDVLEAAVFGIPDELFGESVRAAVVLRPGATSTAESLIAFCRERLTHYKCPRAIDFVTELPRTGSGKITKRALRDPFWVGQVKRV